MAKYDGWIFKNKWGSLIIWTLRCTRKETRQAVSDWKAWERLGHKTIKVKLVEVK